MDTRRVDSVEITAGLAHGSMALLDNGLHMGSHATALVNVHRQRTHSTDEDAQLCQEALWQIRPHIWTAGV